MKVPVKYTTFCPTCKADGEERRLFRNLDDVTEGVMCDAGHMFPSLQDAEELLGATPAPEPVKEPEPTKKLAPVEEPEDPEPERAAMEAMEMIPPPAAQPTVVEPTVEIAEASSIEERLVEASTKAVATLVEENTKPSHIRLTPYKTLPGGDIAITLRIPDQHVSFCQGEAEARGLTLQEHMQAIFEFGLDSRWWY